jgi:hypothetical protein
MLRTEQESEREEYTIGMRALNYSLSILSVAMILLILIRAWISKISQTGYWSKPVKIKEPVNKKVE